MTIFAIWLMRLLTVLVLLQELLYRILGFGKNTWLETFERQIWIVAIFLFVDTQIIKLNELARDILLFMSPIIKYIVAKLILFYNLAQTMINHEMEKMFDGVLQLFR